MIDATVYEIIRRSVVSERSCQAMRYEKNLQVHKRTGSQIEAARYQI